MRFALDTNVLAYAEGTNGDAMKAAALDLMQRLPGDSIVLPVQTLGELFNVLVRKAGRSAMHARTAILSWRDAFPVVDTSDTVIAAALDLAANHQFHIWDAVILAAASQAGCRLLLSQNLQEGFTWSGVTITNPFSQDHHALLDPWLGGR